MDREAEAEVSRRRALRIADEHLKLNPDDSRARYLGANALVALGQVEKGLEWADRALAIEPDEAMLLYNLGCIKSMAGKLEEAVDHLEAAFHRGLLEKGWFEQDSNLDPVRDHPRFQALMKELTS